MNNRKIIALIIIGFFILSVYGNITSVKADSSIPVDWSKRLDGLKDDRGHSVQQTSDGGFIIGGYTNGQGHDTESWLIKIDNEGNHEWNMTYEGCDIILSVKQTSDGGFIFTGHSSIIKTNISGNIEWDIPFGINETDKGKSVVQTSDGGYIILGEIVANDPNDFSPYDLDVLLVKIDSTGIIEWSKAFRESVELAGSILQVNDSGFIFCGTAVIEKDDEVDFLAFIIKTDSQGNKEWEHFYENGELGANSIKKTDDGNYIVTGEINVGTNNTNINIDVFLLKVNSDGHPLWEFSYGSSGYDTGWDVIQISDGGYMIIGEFGTTAGINLLVIETDENGDQKWSKTHGNDPYNDIGKSIQETVDGGFIIVGYTGSYGPTNDIWLIKLKESGGIIQPPVKPPVNPPIKNDDKVDDATPGFELIFLFSAFAFFLVFKRKRVN